VSRPPFGLQLLVVLLGGALGGMARHAVDVSWTGGLFPWGTFTINVVGAALLASLPAIPGLQRHPLLPVLLGPGVLGGFTTLSAFSEQSRQLAGTGHAGIASTYVVGTFAAALLAVLVVRRTTTPAERVTFEDEGGDE
jgi:CrcB protein